MEGAMSGPARESIRIRLLQLVYLWLAMRAEKRWEARLTVSPRPALSLSPSRPQLQKASFCPSARMPAWPKAATRMTATACGLAKRQYHVCGPYELPCRTHLPVVHVRMLQCSTRQGSDGSKLIAISFQRLCPAAIQHNSKLSFEKMDYLAPRAYRTFSQGMLWFASSRSCHTSRLGT